MALEPSALPQRKVKPAKAGVVVATPTGHITHADPGAREWLKEFFGRPQRAALLPRRVLAWMKATPRGAAKLLEVRKGERRLLVRRCMVASLFSIVLQVEMDYERRPGSRAHGKITPREIEVAHWMAAGKTNGQIAQILHTAPGTVGKHAHHLFVKLGVETRLEAAQWYDRRFTDPSARLTRDVGRFADC